MSVAFYSDETESINLKIPTEDTECMVTDLEIDRCCEWIKKHNFSKVALQFPDNLLNQSTTISQKIAAQTEKDIFILADTSYGSCCVDEIAAEHIAATAIIHFGHACLSLTQRLPVLYIFGKSPIDISATTCTFKKTFPDVTSPVIIYYEVSYYHIIDEIVRNLKDYENLVVSKLIFPHEECEVQLNDNQVKISRNQRCYVIPKTEKLNNYSIFYIGYQNRTFINVMLSLNKCKFYLYNPIQETVDDDAFNISEFLGKRYYYIEMARDATIIGILIGTLGVSNYVLTIKRLREAIVAAGKKTYVMAIGKLNNTKLANFLEIEVFVNVACSESTLVDCKQFFQPVITPYELEIALNIREWSDDYIMDFDELLPDGAHHIPLNEIKPNTDVSLITGKTRSIGLSTASEDTKEESSAIIQRDKMVVSEIHSQAAGEFLSQRSWKGLEQHLGETPAAEIQKGRKGIACEYKDEGHDSEQN